jgi:hypothetical protein
METKCQTCDFNLQNFTDSIELAGYFHSIHCPVCGTVVVETAEFQGVLYDEIQKGYVIWDLRLRRSSGPASQTQRVGQMELTVNGISLNPNDLCYEKVIIFQHDEEIVLPQSIIRPEFRRYLTPYARPTGRWEPPYFIFDLPLRGDYTVPVHLRALVSQSEISPQSGNTSKGSALNLWPAFKRKGWRNYFVYFASSDPNIRLQSLTVYGQEGQSATFVGITARGEVNFVPELIEIKIADNLGAEYWSCYHVEFKDNESVPAPAGGSNDQLIPVLSLDFGTSNTCFAVKLSENSLSEVIQFRDRTKRIVRGFSVEDSISVPWLPEIEPDIGNHTQLPSELSFSKETDKIGPEIETFRPIVDYTIPPSTRYREGEEKFIQGEFKWEAALPPPLKAFTYRLQYLYLTLAFRMALAEVVSDPRCQRLDQMDLVATCPLAFGEHQREMFRKTVAQVQEDITNQTGVNIVFQKMYDESHAGESGSGQMPGTVETVYVDVGGGTTDVGFFRFEQTEDRSHDKAIYLDSMQYAGDDVWNSLTQAKLSMWGSTKFEREARARGAAAIFNDPVFIPFQRQRNNSDRAKRGLRKFIDGLVEYVTRMIAARERNRVSEESLDGELGLYLLGNGWRFIEVLNNADKETDVGKAIASRVKTLVEERLTYYGVSAPPLTVIYPIVKDRDPKTVVTLGAISLFVGEKAAEISPEPEFTLKSFLGSDVTVLSPLRLSVHWYETLPYLLPRNSIVRGINYEKSNGFDFEKEQVNGMRIQELNLLDHTILAKKADGTYLTKNMMAFYLENWHKKTMV